MSNTSLRDNLFTFLSTYDLMTSGHLLVTAYRIIVSEEPLELLPEENVCVRFHLKPPKHTTYDAVQSYVSHLHDYLLYDYDEF
jgi:hypothetical protein